MQRTLLDFTQDVLSSLGSDEVNSINDTLESQSVSKIIRRSFYNIVDRRDLKDQANLFQLEASADSTKPTLMIKPNDVRNIIWLKYDCRGLTDTTSNYTIMTYLEPDAFVSRMADLNEGDADVETFTHVVDTSTMTFTINNDRSPQYYTSFNDKEIFFDSYDADVDTTLQKIKTQCYGEKLFQFSMVDSFIPPLTDEQQNLLLNEAISLAWVELKQAPNPKAENVVRKQWIRQQHTSQTIPAKITPLDRAPNFGRK